MVNVNAASPQAFFFFLFVLLLLFDTLDNGHTACISLCRKKKGQRETAQQQQQQQQPHCLIQRRCAVWCQLRLLKGTYRMCSGTALLAVLKELLRSKGGICAKTQSTEALCGRESQHWSLLKRCGTKYAPASLAVALVELNFFIVCVCFFLLRACSSSTCQIRLTETEVDRHQ